MKRRALIPALAREASNRGVLLEDANVILPPTRQYSEADVRQAMIARGVDGVLVVSVTGDTLGAERRNSTTA
jgi:ABC-type sugar transport system substrate-binding protein